MRDSFRRAQGRKISISVYLIRKRDTSKRRRLVERSHDHKRIRASVSHRMGFLSPLHSMSFLLDGVCMYLCVCVGARVCSVCMSIHVGPEINLRCLSSSWYPFSFLFLRWGSLTNLELGDQIKLTRNPPVSTSPFLRLQSQATPPLFILTGFWIHSVSHTQIANALPAEPFPNLLVFSIHGKTATCIEKETELKHFLSSPGEKHKRIISFFQFQSPFFVCLVLFCFRQT